MPLTVWMAITECSEHFLKYICFLMAFVLIFVVLELSLGSFNFHARFSMCMRVCTCARTRGYRDILPYKPVTRKSPLKTLSTKKGIQIAPFWKPVTQKLPAVDIRHTLQPPNSFTLTALDVSPHGDESWTFAALLPPRVCPPVNHPPVCRSGVHSFIHPAKCPQFCLSGLCSSTLMVYSIGGLFTRLHGTVKESETGERGRKRGRGAAENGWAKADQRVDNLSTTWSKARARTLNVVTGVQNCFHFRLACLWGEN